MQQPGIATPRQLRMLGVLFAAGLAGSVTVLAVVSIWMVSAWTGGGWANDHMGRMMGGGWSNDHMNRMMGGGRDSSNDSVRQGSLDETVIIGGYEYSPGNLLVPAGARVTWINHDSVPHSATGSGGSWDTGLLATGEHATLAFENPGTFDYFCTVHPGMKARLVVR